MTAETASGTATSGTATSGTATIQVHPATPERWEDVVTIFGGTGINHCWCQYWRLTSSDYSRTDFPERERLLRDATAQDPPPGMVAYLDGEPCGWLGFGPRPQMGRLVRSRTIAKLDDQPVWSVFCFLIRVGFRRKGVARALLNGVIDHAREHGAPGLEAYPVDTDGKRIQGTAAYVGTTRMFEDAGFRREVITDARSDHRPRWLMRLDL